MSAVEVGRAVTVAVSATSANLGPGFDCLGLALDWREQVDLAVLQSGFEIEVSGEGADRIPRDESHLIIRSALVGLADLGTRCPDYAWPGTTPSRTAAAWGPPPRRSWPAWSWRPAGRRGSGPSLGAATPTPSRATRTTWQPRRTAGWSWRTRARTGSRPSRPGCIRRSVPPCSSPTGRWRRRGPRAPARTGSPRRRRRERRPGRPAGARAGRRTRPAVGRHAGLAAPALPGTGHAAVVRPGHRVTRRGFRRGDQRGRTVGPRPRPSHPARRPRRSRHAVSGCGGAAPEPARQSWKPITTGILAGVLASSAGHLSRQRRPAGSRDHQPLPAADVGKRQGRGATRTRTSRHHLHTASRRNASRPTAHQNHPRSRRSASSPQATRCPSY